jgi:hypothetical protein
LFRKVHSPRTQRPSVESLEDRCLMSAGLHGDFDGDHRTDMMVYRPAEGTWYLLKSSGNYAAAQAIHWGAPGDLPIQDSDFDGDGKLDAAVYRPSNETWYIATSSSGYTNVIVRQWGATADVPVTDSDFDGDGKADMAVFRPRDGSWYVLQSEFDFRVTTVGTATGAFAPVLVWSYLSRQWGLAGDVPIANTNLAFGMGIHDGTMLNATEAVAADGVLDRNDMLSLLLTASNQGTITSTLYNDVREIDGAYWFANMPDYVHVLTTKVVWWNPANDHYQGQPLGDLHAGSPWWQLLGLIDKWFLGTDHPQDPIAGGSYQYAQGTLFGSHPAYTDINQGADADCFLLGPLAEVAYRTPDRIRDMFIDNGDGTYTVRFFHNGAADYVTVDRYLPALADGHFKYANNNDLVADARNRLWAALAEKAYAQLAEEGWSRGTGSNMINSYGAINFGDCNAALAQILGWPTAVHDLTNPTDVVNAFTAGRPITFISKSVGAADNIVENHCYTLILADTNAFLLYNPWGLNGGYSGNTFKPAYVWLTWAEVTASFVQWSSTEPLRLFEIVNPPAELLLGAP